MEYSEDFLSKLQDFEGSIGWMYLDTRGNVTVGVGHLLATEDDASALPFDGGDPVSSWRTVKGARPGQIARAYQDLTTARLSPEAVQGVLIQDLDRTLAALQRGLPELATYPPTVQEALCDMAFNLGPAKLLREYPHLLRCIGASDWNGAALQCHRAGIQDARNDFTAALFRAAIPATGSS